MAEPEDTLVSLIASLDASQRQLARYDAYMEGEQPIRFLAPALVREFGERITPLVLNWPRLVTGAFEERLDVEGFRYAGDSAGDDVLWATWQANDLDEQSQQGHFDSIGLGRAYVFVGAGDSADDPAVVTVESPMQCWAARDARTRQVTKAVKTWALGEGTRLEHHAMLYLPGRRGEYVWDKGTWRLTGAEDVYDESIMPVVPLVNQPRILRPDGRSEFHDVIGPADAANKMATDMMVSGEFHAMPRRWGVGIKESDFQDESGAPINAWSRDAGTLWATENAAAKFGQFTESDLAVFHNTIKLLAQLVAQLSGLPPHYAAFASGSQNPTSADAIRSSESQLVKRAERKQTYLGGSWEQVMRLVLRFQTGKWDERARSLETIWRDPATPTVAQKADAIVKLATPMSNGLSIVPLEQARIDLGYTPEQRKRMAEMDRESQVDPYLARLGAKDVTDDAGAGTSPVGV